MLAEAVKQLLAGLEQCDRSLVAPRLQGCSDRDIVERACLSRQAVYRVLQWVKRRLQSACEQNRVAD